MGMPKEPTIYAEDNKVCQCKDVYITPGGCSWLHAVVQIKKQNADDGKKATTAKAGLDATAPLVSTGKGFKKVDYVKVDLNKYM